MSTKLEEIIERLNHTVATLPLSTRNNYCLRYTRLAIEAEGMRVPTASYANDSGRKLAANPAIYGWKRVVPPLPRFTLDYYDGGGIGTLHSGPSAGHVAGHVGIVDRVHGIIYSAVPFPLTPKFINHRICSFVPLTHSGVALTAFEGDATTTLIDAEVQQFSAEELAAIIAELNAGNLEGENEAIDRLFGAQSPDDGKGDDAEEEPVIVV